MCIRDSPNTSYTQNIGVVNLTGVFSRSIVNIGAVILVAMSLFPKLSAVILCVPEPVLGGATLITFMMVFISGVSLITSVDLSSRNMLIMAVSLGIGVGFSLVPDVTKVFGESVSVCLNNGIVPASLIAIALDWFLPCLLYTSSATMTGLRPDAMINAQGLFCTDK